MEMSKEQTQAMEDDSRHEREYQERLDRAACFVMQGMLASGEYDLTNKELAYEAVRKASALLVAVDDYIF